MQDTQPVKESQIIVALKNTRSSTDEIRRIIGQLEERLEKILHPLKPLPAEAPEKSSTAEFVDLAVDLRGITLVNSESIDRLNSILVRLEL